ncbi:MAG: hypothetical protein AAF483_23805, partial [Planctomycetota bacterium]
QDPVTFLLFTLIASTSVDFRCGCASLDMPIKFKCSCGQVLSVPSKLAGKQGQCPKCKKSIKIPVPKSGTAPANSAAPVAPTVPAASAPVAAPANQDGKFASVLDDAGLTEQKGPTCPSCFSPIKPGTVVCTGCGMNFQSGEKVEGYDLVANAPEFDNLYLQEASENMKRDKLMDSRRDKAQMPWWVIMSFFIGAVTLCAAGVIIADGFNKENLASPDSFYGKLQTMPIMATLGMTGLLTGTSIIFFANMSILTFGFKQSVVQGLLCMFLPMIYSLVYGSMNWADCKSAVKAIILGAVLIGFGLIPVIQANAFNHLFG